MYEICTHSEKVAVKRIFSTKNADTPQNKVLITQTREQTFKSKYIKVHEKLAKNQKWTLTAVNWKLYYDLAHDMFMPQTKQSLGIYSDIFQTVSRFIFTSWATTTEITLFFVFNSFGRSDDWKSLRNVFCTLYLLKNYVKFQFNSNWQIRANILFSWHQKQNPPNNVLRFQSKLRRRINIHDTS